MSLDDTGDDVSRENRRAAEPNALSALGGESFTGAHADRPPLPLGNRRHDRCHEFPSWRCGIEAEVESDQLPTFALGADQ